MEKTNHVATQELAGEMEKTVPTTTQNSTRGRKEIDSAATQTQETTDKI